MEPIEINGIRLLNDEEKKIANRLLNEYYPRIQRLTKNITSLKLYIKEHNKEGKRKQYNIKLDITIPGKIFHVKASDWDFARTLHKSLNKAMNELEHKFHTSEQH